MTTTVLIPLTLKALDENTYHAIHSKYQSPGVAIHAFKFQRGDPEINGINGISEKLLLELLLLRFEEKDPTSHAVIASLLEKLNET